MPKKMLMLADADGLWTRRYIQNLLLPEGWQVVLFPIWGDKGKFDDFYAANHVTVYRDTHRLPVIRRIPRLRMWARIALNARDLRKLGPFDLVHNHYLSQRDMALGQRLARRFGARWVCSFWGSDLMRSPAKELRAMGPYLDRCDAISVHNEAHRQKIGELYGEKVLAKTTLLYFGQTGYAAIDRARQSFTRAQCRARYGIDADAKVVCLGYSASPSQQHLAALEAMADCKRLRDMTLVLQMTYGKPDDGYLRRVRERAEALGCKVRVLTDFMDDDQSACLRLCADVFVQSITTDAFSASMQEYLYAGATVLKGAWLPYPQLAEIGAELAEFADFPALAPLLDRALDGAIPPLSEQQRALLPRRYSWDAVREDWLGLYR